MWKLDGCLEKAARREEAGLQGGGDSGNEKGGWIGAPHRRQRLTCGLNM